MHQTNDNMLTRATTPPHSGADPGQRQRTHTAYSLPPPHLSSGRSGRGSATHGMTWDSANNELDTKAVQCRAVRVDCSKRHIAEPASTAITCESAGYNPGTHLAGRSPGQTSPFIITDQRYQPSAIGTTRWRDETAGHPGSGCPVPAQVSQHFREGQMDWIRPGRRDPE